MHLQRQRGFIISNSLLSKTRGNNNWSVHGVLLSICLGTLNICLVGLISTLYLGQGLNALFSKHIPQIKSSGCLESYTVRFTFETNDKFLVTISKCNLQMHICENERSTKNLVLLPDVLNVAVDCCCPEKWNLCNYLRGPC